MKIHDKKRKVKKSKTWALFEAEFEKNYSNLVGKSEKLRITNAHFQKGTREK